MFGNMKSQLYIALTYEYSFAYIEKYMYCYYINFFYRMIAIIDKHTNFEFKDTFEVS